MIDIDFLIVGAGLSGCTIAERIANVLNKNVLILEKRNHLGGNCYSYKDENNIIVHKYGPHLFHTDSKKVFDYLSNFTEWQEYVHRVLGFIDGKKVPIPVNINTIYELFPADTANSLKIKLLNKYDYGSRIPILELFKETDPDLNFFANFIYDKVYKNYTQKQWGYKPEEINFEVTARVPVYISNDNRYFTDKYQKVPLEGYTKLIERMLYHPRIRVMLRTNFRSLLKMDYTTGNIYFMGEEYKGKLIFTGQIDELFDFKYGCLPYRGLDLKFETIEHEYYQEAPVVNYPNDYEFTRITEFKHIHYVKSANTIILKEYPKNYQTHKDIPYYPVLHKVSQDLYGRYKEEADRFSNLILLGRLAEYKYYDMDDAVKRSLDIFEEKIK